MYNVVSLFGYTRFLLMMMLQILLSKMLKDMIPRMMTFGNIFNAETYMIESSGGPYKA